MKSAEHEVVAGNRMSQHAAARLSAQEVFRADDACESAGDPSSDEIIAGNPWLGRLRWVAADGFESIGTGTQGGLAGAERQSGDERARIAFAPLESTICNRNKLA